MRYPLLACLSYRAMDMRCESQGHLAEAVQGHGSTQRSWSVPAPQTSHAAAAGPHDVGASTRRLPAAPAAFHSSRAQVIAPGRTRRLPAPRLELKTRLLNQPASRRCPLPPWATQVCLSNPWQPRAAVCAALGFPNLLRCPCRCLGALPWRGRAAIGPVEPCAAGKLSGRALPRRRPPPCGWRQAGAPVHRQHSGRRT